MKLFIAILLFVLLGLLCFFAEPFMKWYKVHFELKGESSGFVMFFFLFYFLIALFLGCAYLFYKAFKTPTHE